MSRKLRRKSPILMTSPVKKKKILRRASKKRLSPKKHLSKREQRKRLSPKNLSILQQRAQRKRLSPKKHLSQRAQRKRLHRVLFKLQSQPWTLFKLKGCGWCEKAEEELRVSDVPVNIYDSEDLKTMTSFLEKIRNHNTWPKIFNPQKEFIGGYTELIKNLPIYGNKVA